MAQLIYSAIMSLDGYVEDADGKFDWSAPDDDVFRFINDLERPIGTYLYGRRMYETMTYWETADSLPGQSPIMLDFANIWQIAEKIVYSKTLAQASTPKTRIERDFNAESIQQLKVAATSDMAVGGSELAAQAIAAGLVDRCQLFLTPILVGAGKSGLPANVRTKLVLLDERRFRNGVVYLHYRIAT